VVEPAAVHPVRAAVRCIVDAVARRNTAASGAERETAAAAAEVEVLADLPGVLDVSGHEIGNYRARSSNNERANVRQGVLRAKANNLAGRDTIRDNESTALLRQLLHHEVRRFLTNPTRQRLRTMSNSVRVLDHVSDAALRRIVSVVALAGRDAASSK